MNKWLTLCIFVFAWQFQAHAEYFIIKNYQVDVKVQQDASLDITEIIDVTFSEPRHGIYRNIPFRFKVQPLTAGEEKANRSASSDGYTYTWIRQISVENHTFETGSSDDYKVIKIGSANAYVEGDVRYIIHYKVLNAINFFDKHAELYFNLIGNLWEMTIEHVAFNIEFYQPLPKIGQYFTATGALDQPKMPPRFAGKIITRFLQAKQPGYLIPVRDSRSVLKFPKVFWSSKITLVGVAGYLDYPCYSWEFCIVSGINGDEMMMPPS
jgi:hypothetical protein